MSDPRESPKLKTQSQQDAWFFGKRRLYLLAYPGGRHKACLHRVHSRISPNVNIGQNSIIGSGGVVTDMPTNIPEGNPAKPRRTIIRGTA